MKQNFTSRALPAISGLLIFLSVFTGTTTAQVLPHPDHVVICIMENHPYTALSGNSSVYGSSSAPYINALAHDTSGANFTNMHAIEHPSQPNYLDMFSGSNQGITNDNVPGNYPFTTANLARQLTDASLTFVTYSEDLPSVGFDGDFNSYKRKHNPVTNWVGTGANQVDSTVNQPLTSFPSPTGYDSLPTFCYVVPNQDNDMHNGSDPARIGAADTWLQTHLDAYIQWAKNHNSLFVLTWDEDDGLGSPLLANHIPTIFVGEMVLAGQYSENINHYDILRTIEDIYGLGHAGQAASKTPITDCWKTVLTGVETSAGEESAIVYPNPSQAGSWQLQVGNSMIGSTAEVFDTDGRVVFKSAINNLKSEIAPAVSKGVYLLRISSGKSSVVKKLIRL